MTARSRGAGDPERAWALAARLAAVRRRTLALAAPLSPEDALVQSMPDASPAKWHLAHTTWFFETFVLARVERTVPPVRPARTGTSSTPTTRRSGPRQPRPRARAAHAAGARARCSRYRAHVDERVAARRSPAAAVDASSWSVVELGHRTTSSSTRSCSSPTSSTPSSSNPLRPAYAPPRCAAPAGRGRAAARHASRATAASSRSAHAAAGFAFDNERPRHRVCSQPFALASRPVTNGEWLAFIEDGGYRRPELWLSDGWAAVQRSGWQAPLYWERRAAGWRRSRSAGLRPLDPSRAGLPRLSFYEADAYARWAGARLPTEAEWEAAAAARRDGRATSPTTAGSIPRLRHRAPGCASCSATSGSGPRAPTRRTRASARSRARSASTTASSWCNQLVLRGGSCATPRGTSAPTYRNFFPPDARWQFSGVRARQGRLRDRTRGCEHRASSRGRASPPGSATTCVARAVPRRARRCRRSGSTTRAGRALFERICELPEYYPTRTELGDPARRTPARWPAAVGPGALRVRARRRQRAEDRAAARRARAPRRLRAGRHLARARCSTRPSALRRATSPASRSGRSCADFTAPVRAAARRSAPRARGWRSSRARRSATSSRRRRSGCSRGWRATRGPGGALVIGVDLRKDERDRSCAPTTTRRA